MLPRITVIATTATTTTGTSAASDSDSTSRVRRRSVGNGHHHAIATRAPSLAPHPPEHDVAGRRHHHVLELAPRRVHDLAVRERHPRRVGRDPILRIGV